MDMLLRDNLHVHKNKNITNGSETSIKLDNNENKNNDYLIGRINDI